MMLRLSGRCQEVKEEQLLEPGLDHLACGRADGGAPEQYAVIRTYSRSARDLDMCTTSKQTARD